MIEQQESGEGPSENAQVEIDSDYGSLFITGTTSCSLC